MKKVVIIDYQLGNLFSVLQACKTIGIEAVISSNIKEIESANAIILPGVGAFPEAMNNLNNLELVQPIIESVKKGKPIFGICLGQQLLLTESEEFENCQGLNLVAGNIKRIPSLINNEKVKVPQIAWNQIIKPDNLSWESTPFKELQNKDFLYFVHSYYTEVLDQNTIGATTNYCELNYTSAIIKDNIFSTQFHPEKSGVKGMSIYKNWAKINQLI
jgi:glutamine amidotransferase